MASDPDIEAVKAEGRRLLEIERCTPVTGNEYEASQDGLLDFLYDHADLLLAPAPKLTEEGQRHFDRVRGKYDLWQRAEAQAQADPDDLKADDAAIDLLSAISDEWVLALPHFFDLLDRLSSADTTEVGDDGE